MKGQAGPESWPVWDIVEVCSDTPGEPIVSQSIASETRWSIGLAQGAARVGYTKAARSRGRRALRTIAGLLDDAVWLLLVVVLIPVAILALGTSLALLVRLLLEIAERI